MVSFTGSTQTGKAILKTAANQVLNPAMELGGNAPFVVFEDADIEKATDGLIIAKMRNIGEACMAANRIYLHSQIYDEFIAKYEEKIRALKMGDGSDKTNQVGALISEQALNQVDSFVKDAVDKRAKIILGEERINSEGYFYSPTILTGVTDDALGFKDEIFGPVTLIQKFKNQSEVLKKANATRYGLVAYVFSNDLKRAIQFSESLEFGMVGVNRGLVSDPATPFGGVKQSGLGREGGL